MTAFVSRSRSNSMRLLLPFRNHALESGKLPVDHPRNQHPAAHFEKQVVLAALVSNISVAFGEQLAELPQRLARQDGSHLFAFLRRFAALPIDGHERQPMAVGRNEAHLVATENEQRPIQKKSRVFAGDRKLRFGDHLFHRRARQHRARRAGRFGHRGKIFSRQRLHARVETIGGNLHTVLVFGNAHVGVRKRLHDFV